VTFIGDEPLRAFITDRDGTVNNYCGRYLSSVQSVYNAVFLSRFALNMAKDSVVLTSAPLEDGGLLDISVAPENLFVYAGSKGREYRDTAGNRNRYPIEEQKQQVLDAFNRRLEALVQSEEYQVFPLIGSGVQYKFGQTTVARQDISGSVANEKSEEFLRRVSAVVREVDPDERYLVIEDTGKDIEVILTISGDGGDAKDFDKGDGIRFLDRELGLGLTEGPTLICGDTDSDVPMVEAARAGSERSRAIFVTTDQDLRTRVSGVCAESLFLATPDMLVAALNDTVKRRKG
jgi:phosphoglycolate phosphatase-like HAD superfamily hydrolase